MSVPNATSAGAGDAPDRGPEDRLAPEDRAAIAAVDGFGSLSPLDAEAVDPQEVARCEAAAGALFMAFSVLRGSVEGPPVGLQDRLERAAGVYVASRPSENEAAVTQTPGGAELASATDTSGGRSSVSLLPALVGWAAAAALLIGLLTAVRRASDLEDGEARLQSPTTRMAQLLMSSNDAVELPWKSLGTGKKVRGSVVWSDERNEGYMRLDGLAVNDPTISQYQLWIFRSTDPGAEPYPVDGGVFDIPASGSVVVPISAKLSVGRAGTFAVTVEKPGGVVVSDREQIVVLAQRA